MPLVVKDSWQHIERDEEGELLREATESGVVNVARYYHHESVRVGGTDDDIQQNVRKGLDITTAENYHIGQPVLSRNMSRAGTPRPVLSTAGLKRPSGQASSSLPSTKRSCFASPTKAPSSPLPNRIHRRIVLLDYGTPIYKASCRQALLRGLEGFIEGHESLYKAGILHRDISVNNLMINEEANTSSWPAFLIDLDLAIREQRDAASGSGAKGKMGTKAFMAIGALLGEPRSFMHDLESFFWVLFWVCVHYEGPGRGRVVPQFDTWNYVDTDELAKVKLGTVTDSYIFHKTMSEFFTEYYRPLIPSVDKLRRLVFPGGKRWEKENVGLYQSMKEVLRGARELSACQ